MNAHTSKCRFCATCDGFGCTGELPGMGGFGGNINFRLNCAAWKTFELPGGLFESALRENCGRLWVDGGIRTFRDILVAGFLGAHAVMVGRPFITALCASGAHGVQETAELLRGKTTGTIF